MTHRPACYTTGEPTPRAPRFIDEGRACMNASAPLWWRYLLQASPGCEGCARAERAKAIFWYEQEKANATS